MRPYEVMMIFDVDLEEADIRQRVERVVELVRSRGGSPGKVDYWGRRTFAYEVKHRTEGYYALMEILAEPAVVAEADRMLTLEDGVLRHKVIRLPEHVAGRNRTTHRRPPSRGGSRPSGSGGPSASAPAAGARVAAEAAENNAAAESPASESPASESPASESPASESPASESPASDEAPADS